MPGHGGVMDRFDSFLFVAPAIYYVLELIDLLIDDKNYDEREGLVLSKYFTVKKCPKCKKIELIPTKLKINMDST